MAVEWKQIAYKEDVDTHASQHGVSGSDSVFPADPDADKYLMWDNDPGELVWAAGGSGGGNCNIKTGTYTGDGFTVGDGSTGQAITGVGFRPKWVKIIACHPVDTSPIIQFEKLDQDWSTYALRTYAGASAGFDDGLTSLDVDGFTVDDQGADGHPNADGYVYDYIALG